MEINEKIKKEIKSRNSPQTPEKHRAAKISSQIKPEVTTL
ncbi:hypothetical protein X559_1363 [Paenilisteria newyorkensis]|nr:hypothetical protein X559_1363 [Listeria newyorkensis]